MGFYRGYKKDRRAAAAAAAVTWHLPVVLPRRLSPSADDLAGFLSAPGTSCSTSVRAVGGGDRVWLVPRLRWGRWVLSPHASLGHSSVAMRYQVSSDSRCH